MNACITYTANVATCYLHNWINNAKQLDVHNFPKALRVHVVWFLKTYVIGWLVYVKPITDRFAYISH